MHIDIDVRLAYKFIKLATNQGTVETTHQKLSVELGTAREVISRQLQEFQRRGWIEQGRGKINLIDLVHLENLANHNS